MSSSRDCRDGSASVNGLGALNAATDNNAVGSEGRVKIGSLSACVKRRICGSASEAMTETRTEGRGRSEDKQLRNPPPPPPSTNFPATFLSSTTSNVPTYTPTLSGCAEDNNGNHWPLRPQQPSARPYAHIRANALRPVRAPGALRVPSRRRGAHAAQTCACEGVEWRH